MKIFLSTLARITRASFAILPVVFLLFSLNLSAAEIVIQIVSENNYPLNYIDDKDSKLKGYTAELITAIMDDTGFNYEIKVKPWARVYNEAVTNKNTIIYSVGRTAERENKLIWIGEIISVKNNIYGLSKNKHSLNLSIKDLKQSRISVSKNSLNYNYLKKNNFIHLISVNSYEQTYELLSRGRTDFFTSSVLGSFQFIKKNNLKAEDIMPIMSLHSSNPILYLAANIDTDEEIVVKLKASYQKIVDSGVYNKIMKPLLDAQKAMHQSTDK